MMTLTRNRMNRTTILAAIAGGAIALAPAAPTHAEATAPQEDYEYEPGEGVHEEEWYDPSDWFNDEPYGDNDGSIDYEEMGDTTYGDDDYDDYYDTTDFEYGYHYDTIDNRYEYGWHEDTGLDTYSYYNYDAYYDGYYDGYNDDSFGYDHWDTDWSHTYSDAYTDGYYDGFYDTELGYDYEPYYYVTTTVYDRNSDSDRQRSRDTTRERGDRARVTAITEQELANRAPSDAPSKPAGDMVRRRGTVESFKVVNPDAFDDRHMVLRIRMQDGDTVHTSFGPKMTRNNLPFEKGDRITIRGDKVKRDGTTYIVAQTIRQGDETITLRGKPNDSSKSKSANRSRSRSNQTRSADAASDSDSN